MELTRDEILKMEAGPEMDLLVGEEFLKLSTAEWNRLFLAWQTSFSTNMSNAWRVKNAAMLLYPDHFVKQIRALIRRKTGEDGISSVEILDHLDAKMICQAALLTVLE